MKGSINNGYHIIYINGKNIAQHRLVMEEHLGRALTSDEEIHHIDGDKLNNDIENLQIMTRAEHTSHHHKGKVTSDETRRKISQARMGQRNSPEARLKMSVSGKAKVFTEEHRRNLSKASRRYWRKKKEGEL